VGFHLDQEHGGQAQGWRSGHRRKRVPMSEINVTPFVDVMLVLLIIFMVTAPLLMTGVTVDLPDSQAAPLPDDKQPLQVSLDKAGVIFLQDQAVSRDELQAKLEAIRAARRDDPRLYVRADGGLDYAKVMQVVGDLNAAGFKKVALVTEAERKP
jgi:biopolymer transport protein TolR